MMLETDCGPSKFSVCGDVTFRQITKSEGVDSQKPFIYVGPNRYCGRDPIDLTVIFFSLKMKLTARSVRVPVRLVKGKSGPAGLLSLERQR
jgi:hypothetical protein